MPAPAVRRLVLVAAAAALTCGLAASPAAALTGSAPVVGTAIGPGPSVGDPRAAEELEPVPVSHVVTDPLSAIMDSGQAPLVAAGTGVIALMGAFVVGLSRRPDPVD